jgi:hypothetical protein
MKCGQNIDTIPIHFYKLWFIGCVYDRDIGFLFISNFGNKGHLLPCPGILTNQGNRTIRSVS